MGSRPRLGGGRVLLSLQIESKDSTEVLQTPEGSKVGNLFLTILFLAVSELCSSKYGLGAVDPVNFTDEFHPPGSNRPRCVPWHPPDPSALSPLGRGEGALHHHHPNHAIFPSSELTRRWTIMCPSLYIPLFTFRKKQNWQHDRQKEMKP